MRHRPIVTAILFLALLAPARADELIKPAPPKPEPEKKEEKPLPGLTHYMGREIAQTMHFAGAPWLTRDSRDREEEPAKLMKALGLK
ncbi:MAG TPA: hypothetical protein VK986_12515, partial [Tepidisphaeraceae bacterium]|nr:hypothetical protein [Tepidisphaeraceae bacterium]